MSVSICTDTKYFLTCWSLFLQNLRHPGCLLCQMRACRREVCTLRRPLGVPLLVQYFADGSDLLLLTERERVESPQPSY